MVVTVYGAAREAIDPDFLAAGEELGRKMAEKEVALVFGGGKTGMMGAVWRGAGGVDGQTTGVTTSFLKDVEPVAECRTNISVRTLHERKMLMEGAADLLVIAPGGIGTMDEFFEILTLKQLGQTDKPILLWNMKGCYNPLLDFISHLQKNGLVSPDAKNWFEVVTTTEQILAKIEA